MKKKVDIFLIGSRKAGTTSLANFLNGHPDISLSSNKESNFFDTNHNNRALTTEAYHDQFNKECSHWLDASTSYTSYPICDKNTAQRIYDYNPDAKLIYIVRQPLERIISHYKMSYERGDLSGSLNEALVNHPLLIACSQYYSQIQRYLKFFPLENILIMESDNLNELGINKLLKSFLSLTNEFTTEVGMDNSANQDYRMPRKLDNILRSDFLSSIKRLLPEAFIRVLKKRFFTIRNTKMDLELDDHSRKLLSEKLSSEMANLQKLVQFDISDWKHL